MARCAVLHVAGLSRPAGVQPSPVAPFRVEFNDTSEVVEIDTKTATVARRWPTAPCKQPIAMAIDTAHHRLFSGCRSGLMAISDYRAGKVVATAPIGAGVD